MIMSPISGRIVGNRGSRMPLVVAGGALAVSCAMLAQLDAVTPFTWLFAAYVIFGLGFGLVNAPITNAAVSGMPRTQAGVAAAVASTSRQVGAALGVAVVGSALNSGLHGASLVSGFARASHLGWWILTACGLAVLALGALASGRWAVGTARRTAHLFEEDETAQAAAAA